MNDPTKILALQYSKLDKTQHCERTKEFMVTGDQLKDLRDEIDQLLLIIQNGTGFSRETKSRGSGWLPSLKDIKNKIGFWSCEEMFSRIFQNATRELSNYELAHNCRSETHRKPNVFAAAWVEYFAEWDPKESKWVGNENWKQYYYENYPSDSCDEEDVNGQK